MKRIVSFAVLLGLAGCSTASLQNEAVRLAAINTIMCQAGAQLQPILVPLAATITVAVSPGTAPAVAGAVALDNVIHPELQALCPVGTKLLGGIGSVPAAPAVVDLSAVVK